MRLTVKPFVVDVLETVLKDLGKDLEELKIRRTEIIQITAYSEESWRTKETCCLSDFSERPPANAGVKDLQGVK